MLIAEDVIIQNDSLNVNICGYGLLEAFIVFLSLYSAIFCVFVILVEGYFCFLSIKYFHPVAYIPTLTHAYTRADA
jgi:hypothetical protein